MKRKNKKSTTTKRNQIEKLGNCVPSKLQPLALRSSNFSWKKWSRLLSEGNIIHGSRKKPRNLEKIDDGYRITYVIRRRYDMEIVGGVSRRIAAEEEAGTIESEGVVNSVEHLWWNQASRQEHVHAFEQHRRPRRHCCSSAASSSSSSSSCDRVLAEAGNPDEPGIWILRSKCLYKCIRINANRIVGPNFQSYCGTHKLALPFFIFIGWVLNPPKMRLDFYFL